jgi:hypothetical protein
MEMRQTRRMLGFVAEKSQYRNYQWQEWVAFHCGCAGGGEAEIAILGLRSAALGQSRRKLSSNRIELSQRILRCPLPGKFRGGVGAVTHAIATIRESSERWFPEPLRGITRFFSAAWSLTVDGE